MIEYVNKINYMLIQKLIYYPIYVFAIIITLIHHFIRDDSTYKPKSQRHKRFAWTKKYYDWVMNEGQKLIEEIYVYLDTNIKVKRHKIRKRGKWKSTTRVPFISFAATAMNAEVNIRTNVTKFDSDSATIGINNRCSACISHVPEDFVGDLSDSNKTIKGFGGSRTTGVKVGTLLWSWLDDNGIEHKFKIPNSYYVPQGKVRLLSPQHWAKHNKQSSSKGRHHGTLSQTTSDSVILLWNNRKSKLTIPLSKDSNVANLYMTPGHNNYVAFCAEAGIDTEADQ